MSKREEIMDEQLQRALSVIADARILFDQPLSRYTGFATGGPARYLIRSSGSQAFFSVIRTLHLFGMPFYILGNGTNVLALDEGYDGCVVKTDAFNELNIRPDGTVTCGAGVPLKDLCTACADAGLAGLEFAYGIPGTVGGAVYMNAGAFEGEMKDVVQSFELADDEGNTRLVVGAEMGFAYRASAVQQNGGVITGVTFLLMRGEPNAIRAKMEEYMVRRKEKQPLDLPSCGSTFKRPDGAYASKLIDECGLCGYQNGGAAVSQKHCGFVVNLGGATSADILAVIDHVKRTVLQKTGYQLECEIRILK